MAFDTVNVENLLGGDFERFCGVAFDVDIVFGGNGDSSGADGDIVIVNYGIFVRINDEVADFDGDGGFFGRTVVVGSGVFERNVAGGEAVLVDGVVYFEGIGKVVLTGDEEGLVAGANGIFWIGDGKI